MTDYTWPDDLVPYQVSYYLQSHVLRQQSPFTRQQRIYNMNKPLWICRMGFKGGYDGKDAQAAFGPRLDAWIAKLKGGVNRVAIYDFRRTKLRGLNLGEPTNLGAVEGATTISLTGFTPNTLAVFPGDYVGGDGRAHIVVNDSPLSADNSGNVTLTVEPPFKSNVAGGGASIGYARSWFRLISDDAGENPTEAGALSMYQLDFLEDWTT